MNPFAVLGVPERADLDENALRERFQALSRHHHPDAVDPESPRASETFTSINQAYQALRSAGTRLRELLRLRLGTEFNLKGAIPGRLLDLFMEIGPVFQEVDRLVEARRSTSSALAQALMAPQMMAGKEALDAVMTRIGAALVEARGELSTIDRLLAEGINEEAAFERAGSLCRELLYLEKWEREARARLGRLLGV